MAYTTSIHQQVSGATLQMFTLKKNVAVLNSLCISIEDMQRTRPYLFNRLMEHIQDDGIFDATVFHSGEVQLFYSLIAEEEGLRRSDRLRLNRIIDKTVNIGLMNDDFTWRRTTSHAQIALWVDLVSHELAIPHKWKWAEQRWEIKNLKQIRCNTINKYGHVKDEEFVFACLEE